MAPQTCRFVGGGVNPFSASSHEPCGKQVGPAEEYVADDRRLVRRLQAGERKAYEELVDAYGPRVHRLVKRYVTNPSDSEDVTQEIFIDIYRCIGSFRGESQLMT